MQSPVDVLGVLTTVLDGAMQIREYLRSDIGQALPWKTRVSVMFQTIQTRLDWADSFFIKNTYGREKLSVPLLTNLASGV